MAGGNKKKKKPAANPARAVATTSIQSKSKTDTAKEDSTSDSRSATPNPASKVDTPAEGVPAESKSSGERALHDLSPEEFELQLEKAELQQFVENNASKTRKDASRQISRLQTDKRLLRSQADFLSTKDWLPEELMLQILEFTRSDIVHDSQASKKQTLPVGDSLLAKVWSLRICLLAIDVPLERVDDVIKWLLHSPPTEDPSGFIWGLAESLEWLALNCEVDELVEYDSQKSKPAVDGDHDSDHSDEKDVPALPVHNNHEKGVETSIGENQSSLLDQQDNFEVSDIESDIEPDALLSVYLRTRARLYELNPSADGGKSKKSKETVLSSAAPPATNGIGERKLQQKLRKIESDVLFDQREADLQWSSMKAELAQEAAERKRLQLSHEGKQVKSDKKVSKNEVLDDAAKLGQEFVCESEDSGDNDMLSGMFSALPGVSEPLSTDETNRDGGSHGGSVTVRDFGKPTGMSPKRLLEETCRSRDPRCNIAYRQLSQTTYNCRHSVTITWSKEQESIDGSFVPSLRVQSKARSTVITITTVATPDAVQSESYAATAALFLVFSGFPKEEKAHLRLPPAFRDLWDEFGVLKREHVDGIDRCTVKDLRTLIESQAIPEDDDDEEVVFHAGDRFRNAGASGTITPNAQADSSKMSTVESQTLRDMWSEKTNSMSYQRMLQTRSSLPMYQAKKTALDAIGRHQVVIVVGDTGSGKSTQLPQFILEHELSNGRQCKIYCTEPRRISAISLASRVSEELGEAKREVGTARSLVGYSVRLDSKVGSQTKLVFATVGIVLRMLEGDDGLREITHLCLDEIHERSIDTDFLLIILRSLLVKRPDLKVVLMSATVDAQKFSEYLNGAPIISVPGRTFPVQAKFLEDAIELTGHTNEDASTGNIENADDDVETVDQRTGEKSKKLAGYSKTTVNTLAAYDEYHIDHNLIVKLVEQVARRPEYERFSKAILIFLPGIGEIRRLHDMILGQPCFAQGWRVYALHSSFSSDDQQAAFDVPPHGVRKIVLATNIAETGITIPDVTCVIDTGKHREMRFDERRQMSRLIQSFVAKANAKQRRGRAGRVQEGICFHLFTKHRFESLMVEQQTPEMLRLSLQDLVMRVKICKLGDIEHALSQALDPPSSKNIRRAIDALIEVDALTAGEHLTPLGHQLAKLPLDAQLGKVILYGAIYGCLDFTLTVAAAVGAKSPFLSPMHAKKQADSVRLGFKRGDSDLLTLYNAYATWRKVCNTPGIPEHQFCNRNFLSPQNLCNIEELKAQLLTSLVDAGFVTLGAEEKAALARVRPGSRQRHFVQLPGIYTRADDNDAVATSVVAWSFYPRIVKQEGKGWRNIANNQSLALHPTSVNSKNNTLLSPSVKFLSFYSIMQSSSSKFTNAQETSPVSDFALVLLAGDAVFHMYAGVIVVDGNRLRFKVRDWKTMAALKMLRAKLKAVNARLFKSPGRDLSDLQRKWMELVEKIFELRQ